MCFGYYLFLAKAPKTPNFPILNKKICVRFAFSRVKKLYRAVAIFRDSPIRRREFITKTKKPSRSQINVNIPLQTEFNEVLDCHRGVLPLVMANVSTNVHQPGKGLIRKAGPQNPPR